MRTNSNRHEVLEMLRRGVITVDEAVRQIEYLDGRRFAPLGGMQIDLPTGGRL